MKRRSEVSGTCNTNNSVVPHQVDRIYVVRMLISQHLALKRGVQYDETVFGHQEWLYSSNEVDVAFVAHNYLDKVVVAMAGGWVHSGEDMRIGFARISLRNATVVGYEMELALIACRRGTWV